MPRFGRGGGIKFEKRSLLSGAAVLFPEHPLGWVLMSAAIATFFVGPVE